MHVLRVEPKMATRLPVRDGLAGLGSQHSSQNPLFFFFFITLGPEMSDVKLYEP